MTGSRLKFIKPTVPIPAVDWNVAVDELRRNRPLTVLASESGGWGHPWKPKAEWNADELRWEFSIKPGFINGQDVEVDLEDATVKLTDDGVMIPVPALRRMGEDATHRLGFPWLML